MNVYILIFIILIVGLFYSFTMSIVKKEKDTNTLIADMSEFNKQGFNVFKLNRNFLLLRIPFL